MRYPPCDLRFLPVAIVLMAIGALCLSIFDAAIAQEGGDVPELSDEARQSLDEGEEFLQKMRTQLMEQIETFEAEFGLEVRDSPASIEGAGQPEDRFGVFQEALPPHGEQSPEETTNVATEIQNLLKNAGCYASTVDGIWGPRSQRAASDFARHAGLSVDADEPTARLAALLNDAYPGGRVCPLACDARHEVRGDACVLKTCAKGQRLDRRGRCIETPVRYGSMCTMGTRRLPEADCHFWHSMMQEDRHRGVRSSPAAARYNCQCR